MKTQMEALVHHVQDRFGLNYYYLRRHHYFYEVSRGKTSYFLSMEWFPNGHEEIETDLNPSGTACIDIDIHTEQVKSVVFVQKTSFAVHGDYPPSIDAESVIEWVESLTSLTFGKQFQLLSEEDGKFTFQAVVDNIPVYPSGSISVEFNEENKLCAFIIDGVFPEEAKVEWEPFSLTSKNVYPVAKLYCNLTAFPDDEDEKWSPIYVVEDVFLANDGVTTISSAENAMDKKVTYINKIMEWNHPLDQSFTGKELDFNKKVSEETALLNKAHPDSFSLTDTELTACIEAVLHFLRTVYSNTSGKWILKQLHPEHEYIHSTLRPFKQNTRMFNRKLTVILDRERCNVINYVDNTDLLDSFCNFQPAEPPMFTQQEAFQKLQDYVTVTPQYVYTAEQNGYILCGKIDCDYGIHAVTGAFIRLDDL